MNAAKLIINGNVYLGAPSSTTTTTTTSQSTTKGRHNKRNVRRKALKKLKKNAAKKNNVVKSNGSGGSNELNELRLRISATEQALKEAKEALSTKLKTVVSVLPAQPALTKVLQKPANSWSEEMEVEEEKAKREKRAQRFASHL